MKRFNRSISIAAISLVFVACAHATAGETPRPVQQQLAASIEGDVVALIATVAEPHLLIASMESNPTVLQAIAKIPDLAKNPLFNRARRIEKFGSALDSREECLKIGVDPLAGLSVLLHSGDFPVILTKVTDANKLLALGERLGGGTAVIQGTTGGITRFSLGNKSGALIELGDRTAVVGSEKAMAYDLVKLKRELSQPTNPLSKRESWTRLAPNGNTIATLIGDVSILLSLSNKPAETNATKVLQYIRGFAMATGGMNGGLKLWIGERLKTAIPLITGPHRAPPEIANSLLQDDHLVVRLRLGLPTLLEGITTLLPQRQKSIERSALRMNQMLKSMGLSIKLIGDGLSGDIVAALPVAALNPVNPKASDVRQAVVALAANDPKVLAKIMQRFSVVALSMGGEEMTIAGRPALSLPAGPMPLYLVLADSGLLVGLQPSVLAARLSTPAKVKTPELAAPATFIGTRIDATQLLHGMIANIETQLKTAPAEQHPALNEKLSEAQASLALAKMQMTYSDQGDLLVGAGTALPATAGLGLMAAIAIPNFIKFSCRAKQSEAKSNLKAAFVAQMSYHAEYGQFGSIQQTGFAPTPGNRYTTCFSATDCHPCDGKNSSCQKTLEAAKAACQNAFYSSENGGDFRLCAAGNLDRDTGDLDIWTIDRNNRLQNAVNDCN
jgi:type II secretory pathway pseudopilin PulG